MKHIILTSLLLCSQSVLAADGSNSAIYEEAILPSFAETESYQSPEFSVDFELDIMVDSQRFGAELKFAQALGTYFSIVESATYYRADTAQLDYDEQFIVGGGALFTPLKNRLISPFAQIDLGYLGWIEDTIDWTGSPFAGHRIGLRVNLTSHFGLLVQKRDLYLTRESPVLLHGKVVEGKKVSVNDVSFMYHITI